MTLEEVSNNVNGRNVRKIICSFLILTISFISVVSDIFIGLALITQYYSLGYKLWAIITFSFIFFPSVGMQILSIKLYLSSRNMVPSQWLLHSFLLGIIYRYISAIRKCVRSYKSKSCLDSNLEKTDFIILKNLYLFKSFLECAPQLVLQLYFMVVAPFSLPLMGITAATSAFSIAWALIIHTKVKKGNDCPGLVFLVLWRVGLITARISALVLCAYTCGPWMILFIGSHWLAMTLWIKYQKSSLDEKEKKGEFHSALFGVIYCFCFVSVKTGQSRSKAIIFNSLLLFQNLIFLAVFLLSFSDKSPVLAVVSFVTVTFGSLLGITSFIIYNTFFHPSGPFKCITSQKKSTGKGLFSKKNSFPVLTEKPENADSKPEIEQLQDVQSPSDSIIIIEENPTEEEPKPNDIKKESEEVKLSAALKRRAICSSVDLTRFLDTDSESNKSTRIIGAEETPSDVLSTHDYENLCAVNIARELWGIRSWRVYSDIVGHDDSVFNEMRMDNMTTSSEYSGKDNIPEDDCEIDTNSDKTSVNFVPPFPASMLHTILEEHESPSGSVPDIAKHASESALVATIDKICLYTPLRSRSASIDNETPEIGRNNGEVKREQRLENETLSPFKEKLRSVQKFNIFKERYETNRYQVCGKVGGGSDAVGDENKENRPGGSRDRNNAPKKSFKEKSSFLVQMLTPSKLEKRTFPISPSKR